MGNDLLVLEAPSVTAGFKILNSLPNVKLLDAEPVGDGRFLIVVRGEASELRAFAKDKSVILSGVSQDMLDAIYSLASNALDESLVVVETPDAVRMFTLAHELVTKRGLRAIEIKIRKSSAGAYGYFTGSRSACESAKGNHVEVFTEPSDHLKSMFGN